MNQTIFAKAFGNQLPSEASEIQWMPPGTHRISAWAEDKRTDLTVQVTAITATRLQTALDGFAQAAAKGEGDLPYFDFNHEDGEAAGHPTRFFWGGDDPVKGGIRATVEWTATAKAKIQERAFRRFSPSFFVDANGEVTGAPLNMGGLVNSAAFKRIQPIVASAAGDSPERTEMDPATSAAEITALKQKNAELEVKLAAAQNQETIKAKDSEIAALKGKIISFEQAQAEAIKVEAKAAVADAVAAGKLPAKDTELQTHYESVYAANPAAGKVILAKMPIPTVLGTVVQGGAAANRAEVKVDPAAIWNQALKAKESLAAQAGAAATN